MGLSRNLEVEIRNLTETDYHKGFIECLSVLTETGEISYEGFVERMRVIKERGDYTIIVAEYGGRIVGSGTLFVEHKFIHGLGKKGHVEDVAVPADLQGHGIGKKILSRLLQTSIEKGCYKTALCCAEKNIPFYKKCGFVEKEREMVVYHNNKSNGE